MSWETLEDRQLLSAAGFDPHDVQFHTDVATATVLQADGKIIVVGAAQRTADGDLDFAIARFNPDGTPDLAFGDLGMTTVGFDGGAQNIDVATSVSLQSDGRIIVGGYFQRTETNYDFGVIRLFDDGVLDSTFAGDGRATIAFDRGAGLDDRANALAIDEFDRIILVGYAEVTAKGDHDFALARLEPEGDLDTDFSQDGKKTIAFNTGGYKDDRANAVTIQPNGTILLAGYAQRSKVGDFDFAVARVSKSGNMDTSLNKTGKRALNIKLGGNSDDRATAVAVVENRIVLSGYAEKGVGDYDFAIARLTMGGSLDKTFNGDGKQSVAFDQGESGNDRALDLAVQEDGRIYLIGYTEVNDAGDDNIAIARITTNGSLDRTFGFNDDGMIVIAVDLLANGRDRGSDVAINADGNIVIAGSVKSEEPLDLDFALLRLLPDGQLDTLFSDDGFTTLAFNLTV